jgi:FtsH-binding integral membrane protein
MSTILKKMYSTRGLDLVFSLVAVAGTVMLVLGSGAPVPAVEATSNLLVKTGALGGVLLAAGLLAIAATRFDLKHADDYASQAVIKSAYQGMYIFIFAAGIWHGLLTKHLGQLPSLSMIGLCIVSWSLGYIYTRMRGTGAEA